MSRASPASAMDTSVNPEVAAILRALAPEEIDMLRDAFIFMDKDSDGFVSRTEMLKIVSRSVDPERYLPLKQYLTPLFDVADKDGDGQLSLIEFLVSFVSGPGVLPAEVINSCVADVRVRLTDEEVSAIQDNFRFIDRNRDGFIDREELDAALRANLLAKFPDLSDSNFKEIVAVIMTSADANHDGKLSLSEFIRSFQEDQGVLPAAFAEASAFHLSAARELTSEELEILQEAFGVLDKDGDGIVEFSTLYESLWETLSTGAAQPSQIRDLCELIMVTADRHHANRLTVADFIRSFIRRMLILQISVHTAQEKIRNACAELQQRLISGDLDTPAAPVSDERRSSTVSAMGVPTHGLYVNGTDPIGLPIKGVYLNDCGIPVDVHGCPVFNLYVHGADARGVPIKGMYVDAAGLPVDIMGQPVGGLYVGGVNTSGATIRGVYLDAEGRPIDDHGEVVEGMQEEGVDGNGVPIKGVRANARGIPITPAGLPLVGLLVNGTTPNRMPIKGVYVNANGEATDRQGGVLAGMTVEGVDANGMPIKGVFVAPNGLPAVSTLPKRHYIDGVDGNGYPIKGLYVDKSGQAINGAPLDGLFVDGVDTHGFPLKGTHVDSKGEPLRVLLIDGKDSSGKSIKGLPVNVCGVPVDADGFPVNVMQVDGTTADGQTLKGVHVDSNGIPVDADGHPVRGYWVEGRCSHGSVMRGLYLNEEGLPVDTHGAVVKGMTVDGVDQNDVPIKGVLLRYIRPSPLLCTLVEGTTADAKEPMRGVVLQAGDAQARDCAGAVIERFVVAGVDKSGAPIMGFRVNEVGVPVNEDGTYFKGLFVDGHDEDGVAIKGVYLDGNSAPIDEHGNIIKGMFAEGVDHFGVPIKGVYVDADGSPILDTFVEGVDEHGLPMKGVYVGTKGEPVDANDVPVEGLYASGVDFNGLPIKGTHVDAAGVPLDRSGASMRGMYVDGVDPFGLPMKGVYTQGGATSVAVAAGFRVKGVDADGQEILGVHVDDDGIPVHGVDDRGDCVKGALFPGVDENARPMRGVYVNERGAALHATPASSCMTVSGVDANDVKLIGLHLNESGELLQLNGEPLLQIPANGMDSHLYAIKGVYTDPVGVPITGSSIGMRVNGVDFNGLSLKGMYVGPSGFPTRGLFVDAACGDGVSVTGFLVRGEDAHGVELCGVYLNESGEPVDGTGKLVSGMYADGTDIDGVPIRGMYTDSHGLPMDEHGAVLRGNVQFPSGAPVRGRCAPGDCTVDRDKMIALLKQLFRDCFDWDDPTLTSVMTAAVTGAGSDQRLSLHNFISNFANGGISQDLVHCCASVGSAPPPESIDGATDEELIIISGALRVLNDRMEVEGSVAMADLQDAISSAFIEEGPEKVEYMLQYVLDHFIRVEDGDRVRWNENVQIEEEELPTDEATTSALCPDAEAMALAELRDLYPSAARAAPTTSGTVQAVQATRDESEPSAVVKSESTAAPEPEAEPQAAETSTNPSPTHEQTSGALVEVQQPKTTTTVAMNRYYAAAKTTQRVPRKPLADFVEESYDYTFEEDLRRLFMKFDKDNLGYLDRQDFKQSYIDLEQYGLERSRPEIDRLFKQYAHGSNRIYFDEFCVLMLKRVRM